MKFSVHTFQSVSGDLIAEFVRTSDGHRAVNLYGNHASIDQFARAFHPFVDGALYAVSPRSNSIATKNLPLYAAVEGPRNQTFGKFLVVCAKLSLQRSVAA